MSTVSRCFVIVCICAAILLTISFIQNPFFKVRNGRKYLFNRTENAWISKKYAIIALKKSGIGTEGMLEATDYTTSSPQRWKTLFYEKNGSGSVYVTVSQHSSTQIVVFLHSAK